MIVFKLKEVMDQYNNGEGMSMYKLSKLTGIRPNTIAQWVHDQDLTDDKKVKSINTETLDKICTALNCEVGEIIVHKKKQY